MPQLTYEDQTALPAFEGGLVDSGPIDAVTRTPGGNVAQVDTITLSGTPGNVETYTVTVQGVPVSFITDATATLQELYDGLIAALQAEGFIAGAVVVTGNGSTVITLTAVTAGVAFTLVETLDASGNLIVANATANVTGSPVPFGRGLARTTVANVATLPSATGFEFEGISINRAKGRPKDNTVDPPITGDAVYGGSEAIPVLRFGRIYVLPEETIVIGDSVFLRHTVAGGDPTETPGRFRKTDVGAEVDQLTEGARWISAGLANKPVQLEINVMAVVST